MDTVPSALSLFSEVHPQRGTRLYELVARQLEELILSGQLNSGDRLPPEAELSQQLSVSRTVVREAVKVLAEKGLVRPEPGRGTFVVKLDPDLLATSMNAIIRVERCTLEDVLELRRMIEVPAAGLAAERAGEPGRAAIRAALAEVEAVQGEPDLFVLADKAFHVAVARAAGNELVAAMVGALMVLCWHFKLVPVQPYPRAMPHHRAICEAIVQCDPEDARRAVAAHFEQIWQDLSTASALHGTPKTGVKG